MHFFAQLCSQNDQSDNFKVFSTFRWQNGLNLLYSVSSSGWRPKRPILWPQLDLVQLASHLLLTVQLMAATLATSCLQLSFLIDGFSIICFLYRHVGEKNHRSQWKQNVYKFNFIYWHRHATTHSCITKEITGKTDYRIIYFAQP